MLLMNANPFKGNLELVKRALRGFEIRMSSDVVEKDHFLAHVKGENHL